MPRFLVLLVAVAAASLVTPVAARGDTPTRGRILVPGDHFLPGQQMAITGSQIEEGAELVLQLRNGSATADLGTATVALDGSFTTSVVVPASFPLGYAELTATAPSESVWSTQVLIGERAEGPPSQAPGLVDDRTVWLVLLAIGIVIFVVAGLRYWRSRPGTARSS